MYRKLAGLGLCLIVLLAAACSSSEPSAVGGPPSPPPTVPGLGSVPGLPTGGGVTHVDVTKAASPSSVPPDQLPENARKASAMGELSTEQKICIDDTIHQTVKGDPSISSDQGKLASVMGSAMSLCAGDAFASTLVDAFVTQAGLTPEEGACVKQQMTEQPDVRAAILGSIASVDVSQIINVLSTLEDACGFTLGDG